MALIGSLSIGSPHGSAARDVERRQAWHRAGQAVGLTRGAGSQRRHVEGSADSALQKAKTSRLRRRRPRSGSARNEAKPKLRGTLLGESDKCAEYVST